MPKFYCDYCGVYLAHSSPSGRKQHMQGRKHINNKIEYYSQLLLEQNQSMRAGPGMPQMNPFLRPATAPLMPGMGMNIPKLMPNSQMLQPGGIVSMPSQQINLPGIQPSNISLPPNMLRVGGPTNTPAPQIPGLPIPGQQQQLPIQPPPVPGMQNN